MSISPEQAVDAAIFLTIYRQAIDSLKYQHQHLGSQPRGTGTTRLSKASPSEYSGCTTARSSAEYRWLTQICYPFEQELSFGNAGKYIELVREVRAFQFSQ